MDIMVPPKPLKPCDSKNHTTASALEKKGSDALLQPAKIFLPAIQEKSILFEEIARKRVARVEDNRFCISVHYCKVREEVLENSWIQQFGNRTVSLFGL